MNTDSIGTVSEEDQNENNLLVDHLYKFKLEPSNVSETSQAGPQIILTDFTGNTVGGDMKAGTTQYAPNGLSHEHGETNNNQQGNTECSASAVSANRGVRSDRRERNVRNNNGMGIVHCALLIAPKTSPTNQVEVVDDRKALRDALYQGIFHRHRRTIFAVGSFLRMLKSRNSSYNTIRSSSEGEDDTK